MIQLKSNYIVEGLRLPVGKAHGMYKNTIPEVLASHLLSEFLNKYPFLKTETDEIILGCALGTGGNMARYATLEAGFSEKTPAYTVDAQCASGLKAIILADNQIIAGAHCILAGGMESNSLAPKRQYQAKDQRYINENSFYTQASFAPPQFGYDISLLDAAQNVALKYQIAKGDMIKWAVESHEKANLAIDNEHFIESIVPYFNSKKDQTLKQNISIERLQATQTSQLIDHTNSAHLHDGACVHLVASNHFCEKYGINPSFKIFTSTTIGGPPTLAPMGVIWAVEDILQKTGLNPDDIDLFEVNESFAVNALAFAQHFQIKSAKINIFGGNLAFGHPFGASGAINILHLMAAIKARDAKRGIVSIAAAGGLGMALLLEAPNRRSP